jgi:signal peptidase I
MAPTIGEGDKFIADMLWRGPYRRGEIIIFKAPNNIRASRIAALPGDRIAMHGGVPIVNGKPANQLPNGRIEAGSDKDSESAALLTEQLPGEASTHQVLNMGAFDLDEMPEIIVPANRLFVLGDNRDRSADSRVPPDRSGVGMVPMDSVLGRPMYIHWSSDRAKIGTRLDN